MLTGTTIGSYTVGDPIRQSDSTTLYTADNGAGSTAWIRSGDVMNEAVVLAVLNEDIDPRFQPYLPTFHGTTMTPDLDTVNIFTAPEGFYTLHEVMERYPDGLDPRDMAWMYRRILVALGFAHQAGYVNASVIPSAVLIHPEKHGLIIFDWVYGAPDGGDPLGVESNYEDYYPPEIRNGKTLTPASDIYMAAQLAVALVGGTPGTSMFPDGLEKEYKVHFGGCLKLRQEERIRDAWSALEYFDALLERLYGKRSFRPFTMEP